MARWYARVISIDLPCAQKCACVRERANNRLGARARAPARSTNLTFECAKIECNDEIVLLIVCILFSFIELYSELICVLFIENRMRA